MHQPRDGHNTRVLWALVLVAAAYAGLFYGLPSLTGSNMLDGIIGVLLGLYICSHPAANAVDMLFLERGALHRISSEWSGVGWLALNALVLLVGCMVIIMGTTRLAGSRVP